MTIRPHGVQQQAHNDLVLVFLSVRRAIGALGYFLPVALAVYGFASGGILPSMSAYYYTPMRDVFVGCLMAQAVFLWSYEGYREPHRLLTDRLVSRVASVAVALVALAPTTRIEKPDAGLPEPACTLLQCVLGDGPASFVHLAAAGVFFAALAVYCLVLFVRGGRDTPEKRMAQRIYRICGWTIVASVSLIGLLFATGLDHRLVGLRPVFWLETLACFAFATSWAIKGNALRPVVRAMAVRRF
ncbi:hypothetical protein [Paracoccus laeviglucosivorans]|uniref:Frag1/DRAM/Sfk1 family protein n=1 Tax=Paracoccus laeviglucosivorans TaxID=1197861 RepID=A0A521FT41_9RHOB|nr:hypothetical protein [Paracoccus laeviglucosivorans]SMO98671.1 hypothetical protein SAMN06265221_13613 [Paracoccus laeviglucosivorans]